MSDGIVTEIEIDCTILRYLDNGTVRIRLPGILSFVEGLMQSFVFDCSSCVLCYALVPRL